KWLVSIVELSARPGGGTTLSHRVRLEPTGLLGRTAAAVEVGIRARRSLERVYRRMDAALTGKLGNPATADFFEAPDSLSGRPGPFAARRRPGPHRRRRAHRAGARVDRGIVSVPGPAARLRSRLSHPARRNRAPLGPPPRSRPGGRLPAHAQAGPAAACLDE